MEVIEDECLGESRSRRSSRGTEMNWLCALFIHNGLNPAAGARVMTENVLIQQGETSLSGILFVPRDARGIVIFSHGSGSGRRSPRNQQVASRLNQVGLGTLLFDLLSPEESSRRANVFDIPLLARRLELATNWLRQQKIALGLPIGYFGASTGAGAALWAAAEAGREISAVVCRGGRPDLAMPRLREVTAPTLLVVGSQDETVIDLNKEAMRHLQTSSLIVVPGAGHLFEEPGALELVADEAETWFLRFLRGRSVRRWAA